VTAEVDRHPNPIGKVVRSPGVSIVCYSGRCVAHLDLCDKRFMCNVPYLSSPRYVRYVLYTAGMRDAKSGDEGLSHTAGTGVD